MVLGTGWRAVSLAIDRAAISRAAFAGFARPARHPVPSTIALPAGVVQPTYAHDLVLARGLLARAGYPHGFTVALAGPLTTTAAGSAANAAAQQRALTIVASTFPVIPLVEIPSQNVTLAGIRGYAAYASQATYYDQLTR